MNTYIWDDKQNNNDPYWVIVGTADSLEEVRGVLSKQIPIIICTSKFGDQYDQNSVRRNIFLTNQPSFILKEKEGISFEHNNL